MSKVRNFFIISSGIYTGDLCRFASRHVKEVNIRVIDWPTDKFSKKWSKQIQQDYPILFHATVSTVEELFDQMY